MSALAGLPLCLAVCAAAVLPARTANAQDNCGSIANAYGPYDYWVHKAELPIVEVAHFTPEVEALLRGKSATIGGDLDYTLRAFPNHPRALVAMMNLGAKEKTPRPAGTKWTVECYFKRAITFRPEDATVRVIYANFLSRAGRRADAVKELEVAQNSGASSPNFHYNLGLAYFDTGDFEKSLAHAHRAYQGGFNLPGLKAKLQKAGKWREPPPVATDAGAKPAAAAEPAPEAAK